MRKLAMFLASLTIIAVMVGCGSKEETAVKIYVQQQLYDKAIAQGKNALVTNPENGDTHYFMGVAYFGKDNELKPEDPQYADSSAVFLKKSFEHFMKAKELAAAAWETEADNNIVSMFGRHFNRGVIAMKKKDYVTAATEYRLATIADPENYQGYYARAGAMWPMALEASRNGEDVQFEEMSKGILSDLDKVLEIGTNDKEITIAVHQTMGDVLYKRGDLTGAKESYEKAIALSPENYSLMLTMGERFYNEQDFDNAVYYLRQGLSVKERLNLIAKDDAPTFSSIGNALSQLGRRVEAIDAYNKVLELNPSDTGALYNLMVTHYKAGDQAEKDGDAATAKQFYKQAITLGDQLIGLDPTRPEYWQVRGLCKRGIADFAGAAADLKRFKDLKSE